MSTETYKALIESLVDQRASDLGLKTPDAFLAVVAELLLQEHDLGLDEIDAGITVAAATGRLMQCMFSSMVFC